MLKYIIKFHNLGGRVLTLRIPPKITRLILSPHTRKYQVSSNYHSLPPVHHQPLPTPTTTQPARTLLSFCRPQNHNSAPCQFISGQHLSVHGFPHFIACKHFQQHSHFHPLFHSLSSIPPPHTPFLTLFVVASFPFPFFLLPSVKNTTPPTHQPWAAVKLNNHVPSLRNHPRSTKGPTIGHNTRRKNRKPCHLLTGPPPKPTTKSFTLGTVMQSCPFVMPAKDWRPKKSRRP